MKREQLQQELELKSTEREQKMQRAFAAALEIQQKAEDEVAALKTKLEQTTRNGQRAIDALAAQVGSVYINRRHGSEWILDNLVIQCCVAQENLKREHLLKKMELTSSDRDKTVQKAFAKALEIQQKSAEETAALKVELEQTEHSNLEAIFELKQQVGWVPQILQRTPNSPCHAKLCTILIILLIVAGKTKARKSSKRVDAQIF